MSLSAGIYIAVYFVVSGRFVRVRRRGSAGSAAEVMPCHASSSFELTQGITSTSPFAIFEASSGAVPSTKVKVRSERFCISLRKSKA